jgi:predicted nucleic acid-binding Zn ribbon protein
LQPNEKSVIKSYYDFIERDVVAPEPKTRIPIPERLFMTRSDKEKRSFVHIGSVLRDMLKKSRLETDTSLIRVWDIWQEAVGEVIAANTRPAAFKGNLLIVNATSSSWLQQLRFLKPEILQKVNNVLGNVSVKDIKFKVGPVD